ncbi:MAG TPA: hypothetical protein VID73_07430 [Ktedonobacterales bacterium]
MSAPSGDAPPLPQRILAGVREVAGRLRPPAVDRSTTAVTPSANGATTTGANGAAGTPQPKFGRGMSRLAIGMLAYVVGSYALQIVLALVNSTFKLGLEQAQAIFPRTTPLVGAMTKFALIYFILVIVLIWALFRFNIIPRDPFGARAQARARGKTPAVPTTEMVSWSARKRAARKAADAAAANEPTVSGDYDKEYERVRAMLRGRRRR